jgi:hypothetical protein
MNTETLPRNSEQEISSTPNTDKVIELIESRNSDVNYDNSASVLSGLKMAGVGYAEILAQYEQSRVEDGALNLFTDIYSEKVAVHIPEDVKAELEDDIYVDILEEQAKTARHKAEMAVILAPVVPTITVESMETPDEAELHRREVAGMNLTIQERDATIAAQNAEIARLTRLVKELKAGQDESDDISTDKEEDLDVYESLPDHKRRLMGGSALQMSGVNFSK